MNDVCTLIYFLSVSLRFRTYLSKILKAHDRLKKTINKPVASLTSPVVLKLGSPHDDVSHDIVTVFRQVMTSLFVVVVR